MPEDDRRPLLLLSLLLTLLVSVCANAGLHSAADAATTRPVEPYAAYAPQKYCHPAAKPGTRALAAWLTTTYRGTSAPLPRRSCAGSVSEHKEGRAVDWVLDAARAADRQKARAFLTRIFATDAEGTPHALARRMGIMYVIWDDHLYASYRQFAARDYLASSCRTVRSCSKTLRHRDHMHLSLSRAGGRGETSWYDGRLG